MLINFTSEGFPDSGPIANGVDNLSVTWNDLLWSAITVGRPHRNYVFQYGNSSRYEALFRLSALRLAVEQVAPASRRLRRTQAATSLDPSEKGAVNYFLGLTLCKLFVAKKLDAPWMLHLDVFRQQLNPTILRGRSRPDLIGQTVTGDWIALESKGRASQPNEDAKSKAKLQAERLVAINGTLVQFRIGAFAYFKNDFLNFFWRDPQPDGAEPRNAIRLSFDDNEFWRAYYQPIMKLLNSDGSKSLKQNENIAVSIREADLTILIRPELLKLLSGEKWLDARNWCLENKIILQRGEMHHDGIQIIAGESWPKRFVQEAE